MTALATVIVGDLYRHQRSRGVYEVIAVGTLEANLTRVVVYRSIVTSAVWVRPHAEFADGRFEHLSDRGELP